MGHQAADELDRLVEGINEIIAAATRRLSGRRNLARLKPRRQVPPVAAGRWTEG